MTVQSARASGSRDLYHPAAQRPQKRPTGLILRGRLFSLRLKVPKHLQARVGRTHWCRALGTGRFADAVRQARLAAAEFETLLRAAEGNEVQSASLPEPRVAVAVAGAAPPGLSDRTLQDVLDIYLSDPSRRRSVRSASTYPAMLTLVGEILGPEAPLRSITRASCRAVLDMLRWLPANYARCYPHLNLQQAVALAQDQHLPTLRPATVNGYMVRFGALLNAAVQEGYLDRNPATGLRLPDTVHPREKRRAFSLDQLQAVFDAPLYTGCVDDRYGHAKRGAARPRRGRFWTPLISLYSGMRLNEISQLDLADVRTLSGIECFVVSGRSAHGGIDKRLKTMNSERVVPVHPQLIALGFADFVARRRADAGLKLFPDLLPSTCSGYYSDPLSKWFASFLRSSGAAQPKTSFHSFRHNFRDALRDAQVEEDIGMFLGGWAATGHRDRGKSSQGYGEGFAIGALAEAVSAVRYPGLDLTHLVTVTA
jgi:integrase